MHILLTNDDGVLAPALWALHAALQELGEVSVVAPAAEQSGVGHAITYRTPLTAERVRVEGGAGACAVRGTPADCVKLAVLELFEEPPDLIVSGINLGLNLGCNVFYSGTVAAVIEGAMYGIRGAAFSCDPRNAAPMPDLARQAVRVIRTLQQLPSARALAYNVNFPAPGDADPPIAFTHHWPCAFREHYVPHGPDGAEGLRLNLKWEQQVPEGESCDVTAVRAGKISVTPLRASLTDHDALAALTTP